MTYKICHHLATGLRNSVASKAITVYLLPNQTGQKVLDKKILQILKRNQINRTKLKLKLNRISLKSSTNMYNNPNNYDYTNVLSGLLILLLWLLITIVIILIYISGLDLSSIGPKNQVLLDNNNTLIRLVLSVASSNSTTSIATNNGSVWYSLLYELF